MHEHAEIEVLQSELHRLQWGAYNREAKRDVEWRVFHDAELARLDTEWEVEVADLQASEEQKLNYTMLCLNSELAAEKVKSAQLDSELATEKWN